MPVSLKIPLHVTDVTITFHRNGQVTTSLDPVPAEQQLSPKEQRAAWKKRVDTIHAMPEGPERTAAERQLRQDQNDGFRAAALYRHLLEDGRRHPLQLHIAVLD